MICLHFYINLYIKIYIYIYTINYFRKPANCQTVNIYDGLGERCYWVLKNRLQNSQNSLTIESVNQFLDNVAFLNKTNQNKDQLFAYFMCNINALELKWLTKILLKELNLGMAQKKIFEGKSFLRF